MTSPTAGARRLLAEQRRQKLMKDRTAQWWRLRTPCNCTMCQIKAAIERGDVRVTSDGEAYYPLQSHGAKPPKH